MRLTAKTRSITIVALSAANLWCASNAETSPSDETPDGSTDAGSGDATSDTGPVSDAATAPSCTESFCRVTLPISDVVALNGLWAKSASDVWVVGSSGYVAHFDGSTWERIATGTTYAFFAVTATDDGTVWSASGGQSFSMLNRASDGGVATIDGGFRGIVTAISAASASEAYAVGIAVNDYGGPGTDNIWRYLGDDAGGAWTAVSPPCPTNMLMQPACAKLRAVWAASDTRQWFAGDDGRVYRTATPGEDDGGGDRLRLRLTEVSSSSLRRLDALWGFGENDIWAVGSQGVIRHWEGGEAWSVVASPVTSDLHSVWGSRTDDVWAAGDDGVVLHWNGATWSQVATPFAKENRPTLRAISGTGNDVWIAGDNVVLRSTNATGGDR